MNIDNRGFSEKPRITYDIGIRAGQRVFEKGETRV